MKKVFINGKIRTVDAENRLYEGMICEDGKISALGSAEEMLALAEGCQVIDLAGKDVLPGFIDAHIHLLDHATFEKKTALLGDARSAGEMVEIVKKYIENNRIPDGEWVTGFGWDQEVFPGGEFPTVKDLDQISDTHPLMLTRRCGHHLRRQFDSYEDSRHRQKYAGPTGR